MRRGQRGHELVVGQRLEKDAVEEVGPGVAAELGVGRHREHGEAAEAGIGADAPDKLGAVHFRHPEVGKHEVPRTAGLRRRVKLYERLFAVARLPDRGDAGPFEKGGQDRAVDRGVVDHQHALRQLYGRGGRRPWCSRPPPECKR